MRATPADAHIRILLVNKFFREGAGAETVFLATRRLLLDAGHEVIDFAMRGEDDLPSPYAAHFAPTRSYASGAGAPLRRVGDAAASIYSPAARRALRHLVRETRPEVAHLHNVYHQLTLSIVDELHAQRVPSVMTAHDAKIVCPSYTLYTAGAVCHRCVDSHPFHAVAHRCIKGSRAASLVGAVEAATARVRGTYGRLGALIAPSRWLGELAAHRYPSRRIHVVRYPMDAPRELAGPPHAERDDAVLFAGRLEEVKGLRPLLAAAAGGGLGARLLVVGDGPLAAEVAAAPGVEWLGRRSHDETRALMRRVRAVIVPSLWEDNSPLVVLEARAAGTPVVVGDRGGLPELVADGEDGLIVDPADSAAIAAATARLAGDAALGDAMAVAGRARLMAEHDPARHLEALERVYALAPRTTHGA